MRGWEGLYGRPRGGEVVLFLQHGCQMNRTRATQASQPHILVHSRPYGW